MKLSDFEKHVDSLILERGWDYYEDDRIVSLKQTAETVFVARVEGTELYSVEVELSKVGTIVYSSCDCPYDMGPICKHQVAVFLALRQEPVSEKGVISFSKAAAKLQRADVEKVRAPDLSAMLHKRSKEDIIDFVLELARENEDIRQRAGLRFADGNEADVLQQSISIIRAYVSRNADRHGYVDYSRAYDAVEGAEMVMEKAREAYDSGRPVLAVRLSLCVMSELLTALLCADDSDGCISGEIEAAATLIGDITMDEDVTDTEKDMLFDRLSEAALDTRYDDWTDWRLGFIEDCSALADTKKLQDKLDVLLKQVTDGVPDGSDSYFDERIKLIRYGMVQRQGSPGAAARFIEEHIKYPIFRKIAIESALFEQDYDAAERLALEGEALAEGQHGLVTEWMEYRYGAYKSAGDLEKQRALATAFILKGKYDYYKALKETYTPEEWQAVYPQIISRLEEQKNLDSSTYTRILIEEKEKLRLLSYVNGRPYIIEQYYMHLLPEFTREVHQLFAQYIENTAAGANDRKAYQRVCAILRTLKKAGGQDVASKIKQKLLLTYARKPAFRDELTRV